MQVQTIAGQETHRSNNRLSLFRTSLLFFYHYLFPWTSFTTQWSYVILGLIKITGIGRPQYTEHWSVDLRETRECGWEEMAAEQLLGCFRLSINDTSRVSLKLALSSQSVSLDHAVVRHCIIHAALLVSVISLGWNPDISSTQTRKQTIPCIYAHELEIIANHCAVLLHYLIFEHI